MDSSDEQSVPNRATPHICTFISFLNLQLNEIPQSEINQTLSSVPKITCITAIADKKIICVFCVSGVLSSPPQSAVQIK